MLKLITIVCMALVANMTGAYAQGQNTDENASGKPSPKVVSTTESLPLGISSEESVKNRFREKFGQIPVTNIRRLPAYGLFEIQVGQSLYYVDEKISFVLDGNLIDANTHENVTEARLEELSRINFNDLPFELAIKQVKGDGSRKIAIFEDPNCGYCKQMRRAMENIDNVTIYTFLYPILSRDSTQKVQHVWCSTDPGKVWDDWMIRGKVPAKANCDAPIQNLLALGQRLQVNGTPAVFFEDGMRVPGAMTAEQLSKRLAMVEKR